MHDLNERSYAGGTQVMNRRPWPCPVWGRFLSHCELLRALSAPQWCHLPIIDFISTQADWAPAKCKRHNDYTKKNPSICFFYFVARNEAVEATPASMPNRWSGVLYRLNPSKWTIMGENLTHYAVDDSPLWCCERALRNRCGLWHRSHLTAILLWIATLFVESHIDVII